MSFSLSGETLKKRAAELYASNNGFLRAGGVDFLGGAEVCSLDLESWLRGIQ